ncbi:MAG: hypothetical protein ABIO45_09355 [Burkholderiaceae bacterium]
MRILPTLLSLTPVLTLAQTSAPTAFPADSVALSPTALTERLSGKTFLAKPVSDPEVRVQYRSDFAFVNVGNASDEWRNFRPSCSEVRLLGGVMYVKRASSGEVMILQPR